MSRFIVGPRRLAISSAKLQLDVGADEFSLELVCPDVAGGRIGIFGYCRPPLRTRDAITSCVLEAAVEDPADQFELELDERVRAMAPYADHDTPARLSVELIEPERVVVRYRGSFLALDPSGETEDMPVDV